eukprot:TRINITY_DN11591_c0_g1_i1.p1 TRINITY_DN11591_c0_g1~~TRINITY_DN11591_c0_g1_i1.p1  ORF type:complete len:582 (+),score=117.62 TRINITY_DN11591_c0_g1_i1:101-1846(+)
MATQVIVIGGGLAGLSAAHSVLQNGGRVLVIERNQFCGGNSVKATSGINAAVTEAQMKLNINDSIKEFERDTAQSANINKDDPTSDLVKVLCRKSAPAVEWLNNKFGVDLSIVGQLGGQSQPRTHRGKEKFPGMSITNALINKFEKVQKESNGKLAKLITNARVYELVTDDNKVIGVSYNKDGKQYTEYGPVIIASGGFAADFSENSLIKKYRPDLINYATTNGEHCQGDGIKIALDIGASLVDMKEVQVHPTGLVNLKDPNNKVKFLAAEVLRGSGALLLDGNGKRFADELGRRDYVSAQMNANKPPFRLILNSKASKEVEWHCKHYTARGLMEKFQSGFELAKSMGITYDDLQKEFDEYNKCALQNKDKFGKQFFKNYPYTMNDYYYASIVCPVVHYTMGGLKIDVDSQVLNKQNEKIGQLYAAGEVCGGIHGKNRLGGNSLLDCVVYGRIAGKNACADLLQQSIKIIQEGKLPISNNYSAKRLQNISNQMQQSQNTNQQGLRIYDMSEISKHDKENDCWIVLFGEVYNLTDFLKDHPGGKDSLLLYAGKDATEQFEMLHQKDVLDKLPPGSKLGVVKK